MIFLGVGSSIGNTEQIFLAAENFLKKHKILVVQKSAILKNPPFGGIAKNEFSNAVWEISIPEKMTPEQLLVVLKDVEKSAGRNLQSPRWSDRILDLDILIFHDQIVHTDNLTIPHSEIAKRDFVLNPLAELVDENFEIPTLGVLKSLLKK